MRCDLNSSRGTHLIPLSHGHCKVRSTRVSKPGLNSSSVHMRFITAILVNATALGLAYPAACDIVQ